MGFSLGMTNDEAQMPNAGDGGGLSGGRFSGCADGGVKPGLRSGDDKLEKDID